MHDRNLTVSSNSIIGTLESVNILHHVDQTLNTDDRQNQDGTSDTTYTPEYLPEHLESLMENLSSNLSPEQSEKLKRVLIHNQEVFSTPDGALGRNDWIKHQIETDGATLILNLLVDPRVTTDCQKQTACSFILGMWFPSRWLQVWLGRRSPESEMTLLSALYQVFSVCYWSPSSARI